MTVTDDSASAWPKQIWRWGVVAPVTLVALAGGLADVITGTLQFWWLLAPSYPVIGIAVWRRMGPEALAAARAARRAELEARIAALDAEDAADAKAAGLPPPKPVDALEDDDDDEDDEDDPDDEDDAAPNADAAPGSDPLISDAPQVSVGSVVGGVIGGVLRVIGAIGMTFVFMVLIWGAIDVATWGKGYWYVYGLVLALVAWVVWIVMRSGRADAPDSAPALPPTPGGDPLVR